MRHMMMTLALIWLAATEAVSARENNSPLPDAKQVKSISIEFDHPKLDEIKFTATPAAWKAIRAALLPAKRDRMPADLESVGTVRIVKQDNQPFRMELYAPAKDPGAFAAGKTFKQRVYYRGGKTAEVIKAINAAYEDFKKRTNAAALDL